MLSPKNYYNLQTAQSDHYFQEQQAPLFRFLSIEDVLGKKPVL
jgi:hypothetical protein